MMTAEISQPGHAPARTARPAAHRRRIGIWLLCIAFLVTCMVLLGGYTRLTHSGLSMVDWRPVTGWLPPLGEAAWQAAFADYQRFPEYQKVNQDMTLAGFKSIYLVEYGHRLFGRMIGLVFVLPFAFFLATRRVDRRLGLRLGALLLLGAGQGVLGWFMVKSGLVDRPDVSHYRLTAHLGLAVLILGLALWLAVGLLAPPRGQTRPGAVVWAWLFVGLTFVQILAGGLVAGLDAGFAYNTFPTMGGEWLPEAIWAMSPAWINFVENAAAVQFGHRILAYLLILAAVLLWWRAGAARVGLWLVTAALAVQVGLGIATLLAMVPVALGVLHQAGALALFAAALFLAQQLSGAGGQGEAQR